MVSALILCASVLANSDNSSSSSPGDERAAYEAARAAAGRNADAHVKLALWCEQHGLTAERLKHLAMAVVIDRGNVKARGLLGMVALSGKWERLEKLGARVRVDEKQAAALAAYNERRRDMPNTATAHWAMALWCEENGLSAEAAAHLTAVTRLDPRHRQAWERLGCKWFEGRWMTDRQIAELRTAREAQAHADRFWTPLLKKWKKGLDRPEKHSEAETAVLAITDPLAVPSILRIFCGSAAGQRTAVEAFANIPGPAASRALATLAAFGATGAVRRDAAKILTLRDPHEFMDLLITFIRKPTRYQARLVGAAGPATPGFLRVEGKEVDLEAIYSVDETQSPGMYAQLIAEMNALSMVQRLDLPRQMLATGGFGLAGISITQNAANGGANSKTSPLSMNVNGQFVSPNELGVSVQAAQRALADYQQRIGTQNERITSAVAAIEASNAAIEQATTSSILALHEITGQDVGTDQEDWAAWWANEQGYAYVRRPETVPKRVITEWVHFSCFGAGTPVRTMDGLQPIETLQVGDRILVQETKTGRLALEPIIGVYHNQPSPTLRLTLGNETVVATGIHRFWKAGSGWVMARDLKVGDPVRTVEGIVRVTKAESGPTQPVFNLEVAAGETFFVGTQGALVHDNSLVQPVSNPFDAVPNGEQVGSARPDAITTGRPR